MGFEAWELKKKKIEIQYNTIQYNTIQYNTIQYNNNNNNMYNQQKQKNQENQLKTSFFHESKQNYPRRISDSHSSTAEVDHALVTVFLDTPQEEQEMADLQNSGAIAQSPTGGQSSLSKRAQKLRALTGTTEDQRLQQTVDKYGSLYISWFGCYCYCFFVFFLFFFFVFLVCTIDYST